MPASSALSAPAPDRRDGLGWQVRDVAIPLAILVATSLVLLAMGRVPVCTCGHVTFWHGGIKDAETSQHFTDPYSFTHITHGFLFYGAVWGLARVLGRPIRPATGLALATAGEGIWEILENLPVSIERFRTATINSYYGDSVLNSAGDILAMMLGFWLASRLPVWVVVVAAIASEIVLGLIVRDNLVLQMLMFIHPIEAIKAWQLEDRARMQTTFSPAQLADPHMASSEKILRTCVHCGFCTATCPTYLLLGDELDSPRGRIYLIKDMLEGGKAASAQVVRHIDRCLSCLSCMTTCPSGVHYMHLVDHARAYIEDTHQRPLHDRLLRSLIARILPYRNRFRIAMLLALAAKPMRPIAAMLPRVGNRLAAMLDLAPASAPNRSPGDKAGTFPAEGARRARVAMLRGCAQAVLAAHYNEAAIRLLNRHGVEVVQAQEGCCGALVHHMGREGQAKALARRTIDIWTAELDRGLDAIVVTASGCGTTIKDYGFMFRDEPAYAAKAKRVSEAAKDIVEYMLAIGLAPPARESELVVAYHSACSMQHGQGIRTEPKTLLKQAGFTVKDVPEGHICCGSAGTYNLLQPEIASRLRERKVANIERTRPDVIATGNIGCITQIGKGTTIPIVHTVELLDWATGGPLPAALADRDLATPPGLQALQAAE